MIGVWQPPAPDERPGPAGREADTAGRLRQLADFFATAAVPMRISADVTAELWSKLMVNRAYNTISGLAQANYGRMAALPEIRELQQAVVREAVALAAAASWNPARCLDAGLLRCL